MCIIFYCCQLQVAPPLGFLEMGIAKMKQTMLIATLMVVTVVHLTSTQNNALNAFAITRRHVQLELLILWLEMDIAKMKPTMLNATMMVVTVVHLISTQNNALNAFAISWRLVLLAFILWLEMDIAKMKPTMLNAAMMVVTAVSMLT